MKKIYITLAMLFAATMAMAYFYFTKVDINDSANELALNVVAERSALIFSFDNDRSFYDILSGQELLQQTLGDAKAKQLRNIGRSFVQNPTIFNAIEGQKTYIGIGSIDNVISYQIAVQVKPGAESAQLLKIAKNQNLKIEQHGDNYQLKFADSSIVFLSFNNGLVLLSDLRKGVEQPVDGKKGSEFGSFIKENSRFAKNTLANLYVDFRQIPNALKHILSGPVNGELRIFNEQDAFAALSYSYSKNKILFNGNTSINNTNSYYNLFSNVPVQNATIDNLFPATTANYVVYATGNYKKWSASLENWLDKHKKGDQVKKNLSDIEQRYRINLKQVLPSYFKDEFATFQLNTGEKFGIVALTNGDKLGQLLLDISADYADEIKIFKEPLIPFTYFGEPFEKFERPFYTIIDNYLVMANNASSVQSFLRSYRSSAILTNDADYLEFNEQLSTEATICFYINNKNSNGIFNKNLKLPYNKQYRSNSGFKSYHAFCYQLIADNGKFLTNFLLYKTEDKPEPEIALNNE